MSTLADVLDSLITAVIDHMERSYEPAEIDQAFEAYLDALKPSLRRYRHHLSTNGVDILNLKQRFKYETSFLHLLTYLVSPVHQGKQHGWLKWPVEEACYPFSWYQLPTEIINQVNGIDVGRLLANTELEVSLAQVITDVLVHAGKRYAGEYYTPLPIARHLADVSRFIPKYLFEGCSVTDPACGGGIILTEIARRVITYGKQQGVQDDIILNTLSTNLYGFDIQPFAVVLTRTLLMYTCIALVNSLRPLEECPFPNIRLFDPLAAPEIFWDSCKKFDFIIANPPYFAAKKEFLDFVSSYEQILYGHPNLYQLFLWWAVKSVASHGAISFLIPQSMIAGAYFKRLREQLQESARLTSITRLLDRKGVVGNADQQMMVVGFTSDPSYEEPIEIRVARNGNDIYESPKRLVAQSRVVQATSDSVIWIISDELVDYEIIEQVDREATTLGDTADFTCGNGEFVWNEKKELVRPTWEIDTVPLISASSIEPYRFKFPYTGKQPSALRQFATVTELTKAILHSSPALLVQRTTPRKVGRRLVAAVLSDEFITENKSYFIENHVLYIGSVDKQLLYGLMGWLNSDLMNFVFQMRNGAAHTSVTELSYLPINMNLIQKIALQVETLTQLPVNSQQEAIDQLNQLIFDAFEFEESHRIRIKHVLDRHE